MIYESVVNSPIVQVKPKQPPGADVQPKVPIPPLSPPMTAFQSITHYQSPSRKINRVCPDPSPQRDNGNSGEKIIQPSKSSKVNVSRCFTFCFLICMNIISNYCFFNSIDLYHSVRYLHCWNGICWKIFF